MRCDRGDGEDACMGLWDVGCTDGVVCEGRDEW
jgi:hypothetical protein